jgi:uncharacterized protein involved in exopolysaccharide biosynthesis
MNRENVTIESEDIDLIKVFKNIWGHRKLIIIFTFIAALVGIVVAVTSKNVFTAYSTFLPKEVSKPSANRNLSTVASLAGINLGTMQSSMSEIPIQLYPKLMQSNRFVESLIKINVDVNGMKISFEDYLQKNNDSEGFLSKIKKYVVSIPSILAKPLITSKKLTTLDSGLLGIAKLTKEKETIYELIKNQIVFLEIDKKNGLIKLGVTLENPNIAARIAKEAQILLQKEIINFKIKNTQEQLIFTEKLFEQKKAEFEKKQDELASVRDQNLNISSSTLQNRIKRLESEVNIASALYEELAKQVETARIQIIKDTPVFTIIDPVMIPNKKTAPNRSFLVIVYTFLGLISILGYVLVKEPLKIILIKIREVEGA